MKTYLLGAALAAVTATSAMADFPEKALQGIIQWGAGGSTDVVMRAVTPPAEDVLGQSVVMTNRSGGVGAIATKYVLNSEADGYTLLMGAENPMMYKVLGLADTDYLDMTPIVLLARGTPIIVAHPDAPYDTIPEMEAYGKEHPGEIKVGSTGPGGLTSIVMAMLETVAPFEFTSVPFDGEGPALTAMQGGAIDLMPTSIGAAIDHLRSGRLKVLGLIDAEPNALLPDVPLVVDDYPEIARYLPWGSFFGIFVKEGTPDEAVATLTDAFQQAAATPEFGELMRDRGFTLMNITGEEATEFLERYRSVSSWIVWEGGFGKVSPEEFDIPKP
jgi:tripartite-type tricarboxylate transporter receptor subunit TctC